MKRLRLAAAALLLSGSLCALAHDVKTDAFQVTGEVTAVDDTSITVMKGKERFHIAKDKDSKLTGDVKVGAKVTVKYVMYAREVEAKAPAKK